MGRFRVLVKPSAVREIERLPRKRDRQRIVEKIEALADEPRPVGCRKLSGRERYRLRYGDYRIVYSIEDRELIVYVVTLYSTGSPSTSNISRFRRSSSSSVSASITSRR